MMRQLLLAMLITTRALGETLLSGAIYFDSKNTLLEVQDDLRTGDTNGLALLFKGNHISDKVPKNLAVILLLAGPESGSPVEFRFANDPTTYWTYGRYIVADAAAKAVSSPLPTPPLSPVQGTTLPADLPSSLAYSSTLPTATPLPTPTSIPPPTPTPTPTPKPQVAKEEEEDTRARPPLARRKHAPVSDDEDVPESAKVWHLVNGHWKWYDRRNYHEVRRALRVYTPTATPYPNVVPRALPVGPPAP